MTALRAHPLASPSELAFRIDQDNGRMMSAVYPGVAMRSTEAFLTTLLQHAMNGRNHDKDICRADVEAHINNLDAKSSVILHPTNAPHTTAAQLLDNLKQQHTDGWEDRADSQGVQTTYFDMTFLQHLHLSLSGPIADAWGDIFEILLDTNRLNNIIETSMNDWQEGRADLKRTQKEVPAYAHWSWRRERAGPSALVRQDPCSCPHSSRTTCRTVWTR